MPRFTDNGDSFTDEMTGLEWKKVFEPEAIAGGFTHQDAMAFVEALNADTENEWRLPLSEELASLRIEENVDEPDFEISSIFYKDPSEGVNPDVEALFTDDLTNIIVWVGDGGRVAGNCCFTAAGLPNNLTPATPCPILLCKGDHWSVMDYGTGGTGGTGGSGA